MPSHFTTETQSPQSARAALRRVMARALCCLAVATASCYSHCSFATEAYRPARDDEVLEQLPRVFLSGTNELATLRQKLAPEPNNTELASQIASRYVQMGSQAGDPRFYGYARATLKPWWDATNPPSSILRLRAKLKEKDHLYDEALADLKILLDNDFKDTQAWVETANIYRVQGRYEQALRACEALHKIDGPDRARFCRIPIQTLTGEAQSAYDELDELRSQAERRWPAAVAWVTTMQAKIAVALALDAEAERHFRDGLDADPEDYYLIREYADYLLDRDRHDEALSLTREHINNDNGILLRAAIAARRSNEIVLSADWTARLESRFREIRMRGNQPHGRFEARYLLQLKDDPKRALNIALANWEKQKEIRDTRNVLEAAIAAGDRPAAQPVLDFLEKHGTQHVILQKLIDRLEDL